MRVKPRESSLHPPNEARVSSRGGGRGKTRRLVDDEQVVVAVNDLGLHCHELEPVDDAGVAVHSNEISVLKGTGGARHVDDRGHGVLSKYDRRVR